MIMCTKNSLGEKFQEIYDDFEQVKKKLATYEKNKQDFKRLSKEFKAQEKRFAFFKEQYYYIAFVGPYSTGKSTFINSLMNRDILPEVNEKASTAFPTYIYPNTGEKEERAEVNYYSRTEREKLKKFYLEKIFDDLSEEDEELKEEWLEELDSLGLKEALEAKEEELQSDEKKYNNNFFNALKSLLEVWEVKIDESDDASLEDMKILIEGKGESIIIKEAKVYVNDIKFTDRKDIVLVDLPGVDADNPRHYKVTEDFTIYQDKTSAFIVVTSPTKLQTSGFGNYLRSLGKHSMQIDKAFWVVNRCDELDATFKATQEVLTDTVKNSSITLIKDRLFACSAKDYRDKKETEYAKNIDKLRDELSGFIEHKLEKEILATVEKERQSLIRALNNYLSNYLGELKDLDGSQRDFALGLRVVENELQEYKSNIELNLQEIKKDVSNAIDDLTFFDEGIMDKLRQKVINRFDNLGQNNTNVFFAQNRDAITDTHETIIRQAQQTIPLNEFIRAELEVSLSEEGKLSNLKISPNKLLNGVENITTSIFSTKKIDATINVKERLGGVSDVMLKNYGNIFEDTLTLTVNTKLNNLKAKLFFAYDEKLDSCLDEDSEQTLIELIESEESIKVVEGFLDAVEESVNDEIGFHEYKVSLLKAKMLYYLGSIKQEFDENIRICLVNHFRVHFKWLEELVFNEDILKDLRFKFHQIVNDNNSKVQDINATLKAIGAIYEKYRDA